MNYDKFLLFLLALMNDPCYRGEPWVVYFKCNDVNGNLEEHYEVFSANLEHNYIEWFDDWYEGQSNIDVWGAYNIEGLVKEERRR